MASGLLDRLATRLDELPTASGITACWWRTFFPALSLFLATAAFILTKTGRDALYFREGGVADVPKAYLLIALLSAPAANGMLRLVGMAGPRRARVWTLVAMAGYQLLVAAIVVPGSGPLMTGVFASIPLLYGVLLSLVWLLGADLLDLAPRFVLARLYASMAASSMLGGITGALAARTLSGVVSPPVFFALGSAALLLAATVSWISHRTFPVAMDSDSASAVPGPNPSAGLDLARMIRQPYTARLAAVGLIAALVGVFIEFFFFLTAAEQMRAGRNGLAVFADLYMVLNGAALALQLFAAPVLQRAVGIFGSLLVLPGILLSIAGLALATASPLAKTGLRLAEGGVKSSIHRINWEQSYLAIERERRAAAKILVDGLAARIGEGLAAGMLLAWFAWSGSGNMPDWALYVIAAGCAVWLALVATLNRAMPAEGLLPFTEDDFRSDLPIPDG